MTKLRVPFPTFVVANFVGITCDEVNKVDNGSWISIHAYMSEIGFAFITSSPFKGILMASGRIT